MRSIKAVIQGCSLLVAMFLLHPGGPAAPSGSPRGPASCAGLRPYAPYLRFRLTPVAGMIGMSPLLQHVRALATDGASAGGITLEEALLRQQITEAILAASFDGSFH